MKPERDKYYWVEYGFECRRALCIAISDRGGGIMQFDSGDFMDGHIFLARCSSIHAEADPPVKLVAPVEPARRSWFARLFK